MERSQKSVAELMRQHRDKGKDKKDNELEELFQTSRIRNRKRGVSPLSLLISDVPQQVQVLSWLMRRQEATLSDIQGAMSDGKLDVAAVLKGLKIEGRISERIENGQLVYRALISSRPDQRSDALDDVWSRLDQDKVRFLRDLPLFEELTLEELVNVADQMELRQYNRNDIILWQGNASNILHIIKSGVVGISYLSADMQGDQIVAYLKQGDLLGEYNLVSDKDYTATASAKALSTVEALLIPHETFRQIMRQHPSVTWGIADMLVQRLVNQQPKRADSATRLSVVVGVQPLIGRTIVGSQLAAMLGRDNTAVYTEYPSAQKLIKTFYLDYDEEEDFYSEQDGFDVAISNFAPALPLGLKVTMLYERLSDKYANLVIGIPSRLDDGAVYLLERADQVVLLSTPDEESWQEAEAFQQKIRPYLHPERTAVIKLVNRCRPELAEIPLPQSADFELPYTPDFSMQSAAVQEVVAAIADRLGRTNQVSLFIPTTVDVDKEIDTSRYVQNALAFLGELFGGATSSEAQGVWNSDEVGLVAERVFIVRSYATKSALDKHLPHILNYVEQIKDELSQEAMAVEVNQKLMLI
ncbi:MAG: cyclic nucleotide-binding domain-containing protein [Anaerolineales bacterium]|nr:cyclic nucleotide-binding domain-containing protein [Anaerolineales bacterium]